MRPYLYLAAVALFALSNWFSYIKGGEHTRAAIEAEQAKAAETARLAADENTRQAAATNTSTQTWLWQALPPIDLRTNEARERVRIVYREAAAVPAADRCIAPARPVRVQQELDAARSRIAAGAGSPVRASPDVGAATDPGLHHDPVVGLRGADGRLGDRGARPVRGGSGQGPSLAHMRAGPS